MKKYLKSCLLGLLKIVMRWLSSLVLRKYKPAIVGITGSAGKTSTKAAVKAVVAHERDVYASDKNFNNELGLPIAILCETLEDGPMGWIKVIGKGIKKLIKTDESYPEVLVLEYGIDRPGDMTYLLRIAKPHIAIMTAIGETPVHVEFFAGREALVREKSKLIQSLPATGFAILNMDDPDIMKVRGLTRARVITFGFSGEADVRIDRFSNMTKDSFGASFKISHKGSFVPMQLSGVVGKTHAYSAAAGASIGLILGMNLVKIAEALKDYDPPKGRLRLVQGRHHTTIIDDTYNASPIAMQEAIDVLKSVKAKRKIAILGDMLELGKHTFDAHEKMGTQIGKKIDMLITVGTRAKFISDSAIKNGLEKRKVWNFMNTKDAGEFVAQKMQEGDVVLAKGSQGVRMEQAVKIMMAEPELAEKILVRQNEAWKEKEGIY